ncbi:MAG: hypothetical protein HYY16_06745 [Planctomycetes bacterium]|nr:hypothetical protein [Planctomycetota bacterium]
MEGLGSTWATEDTEGQAAVGKVSLLYGFDENQGINVSAFYGQGREDDEEFAEKETLTEYEFGVDYVVELAGGESVEHPRGYRPAVLTGFVGGAVGKSRWRLEEDEDEDEIEADSELNASVRVGLQAEIPVAGPLSVEPYLVQSFSTGFLLGQTTLGANLLLHFQEDAGPTLSVGISVSDTAAFENDFSFTLGLRYDFPQER